MLSLLGSGKQLFGGCFLLYDFACFVLSLAGISFLSSAGLGWREGIARPADRVQPHLCDFLRRAEEALAETLGGVHLRYFHSLDQGRWRRDDRGAQARRDPRN